MRNRYLLCFANEHLDFRWPEISSLLNLFNIEMQWDLRQIKNPFWVVEFKKDSDARRLAGRAVSLRSVLKLWGHGQTLPELHKEVKNYPEDLKAPIFSKDCSFRIDVTTFNKHFSMKEKISKIDQFSYLPFEGPVNLDNPQNILQYIEDYGLDSNNIPIMPFRYYFGLRLCDGQRSLISHLSLKKRKFIGNTSMEAQLSLIMTNMAQVRPGSLVLDPFVGSGSLLVAAAQAGGLVLGTDIDYLMLHGRTRPTRKQDRGRARKDESILSNMKQYGLCSQYVDVIVADSSLPLWRKGLEFDAIITDPPYGVREATERIGSMRQYTVDAEHVATHVPCKVEYSLSTLFRDLLRMSARRLVLGGRLVTWLPVRVGAPPDPPTHPALRLIAVSEQPLTANTARRLLTYEKVLDLPETDSEIPDVFPDFRQFNFEREKTRKEKAEEARASRTLPETVQLDT